MAVVTEQTIPFPPETLDLASASRWNALFPLLRPTVKPFPSSKGQTILIDTAKSHGKKYLHIVAVGPVGNFSSKLLDDKHVTAIVAEKSGAGILTAADLPQSLSAAGVDLGQGVCMVRAGTDKVERKVVAHKPDLIEPECQGDLEADHAMHLLGTATGGTRANPHVMVEMLKGFVKSAKTREVVFTEEKVGGSKPGVKGADGQTMGYEKAREVIQKEVEGILKDLGPQEGETVYSVHFSDVNGLSRLENYIVAGEIAQILDRQGVKYALSHSTLLNHNRMARGFGVSIAPIPVHFLDAAPKPQAHKQVPKSTSTTASNLASSKIQFADKSVRDRISNGCNAVIAAEPVITEYDTVVGDGDCGYTLRDGAKKVMDFVSDKDLSRLPAVVADLVRELEVNMGGTSGALYCIFLTALANSLASAPSVQEALAGALTEMCKYTRARVGDRTMMDALIPFIEGFQKTGKPDEGLKGAKEGVEGTKRMEAKLGRSTYLDESATRGVPDPGAYGLLVLLEGMCQ